MVLILKSAISNKPYHRQTSISTAIAKAATSLKAVNFCRLDDPEEICFHAIQIAPEWRGDTEQIPSLPQVSPL